jgi:hypothetical protein
MVVLAFQTNVHVPLFGEGCATLVRAGLCLAYEDVSPLTGRAVPQMGDLSGQGTSFGRWLRLLGNRPGCTWLSGGNRCREFTSTRARLAAAAAAGWRERLVT